MKEHEIKLNSEVYQVLENYIPMNIVGGKSMKPLRDQLACKTGLFVLDVLKEIENFKPTP